jgi:transposase-like protein
MSYSEEFKLQVVAEYEAGGISREALKHKYNIGGNTTISKWINKYGSSLSLKSELPDSESFRIDKDTDKQKLLVELEQARLRIAALEALIEASGNYTGIDIKKKFGGKQ